jgi:hypothetical protein
MFILQKNNFLISLAVASSLIFYSCNKTSEEVTKENSSIFYINNKTSWIASINISKLKKEVFLDLLLSGKFKEIFQTTDQKTFLSECIFDSKSKGLSNDHPIYISILNQDSTRFIALHFTIHDSILLNNYITSQGRRTIEGYFSRYKNQVLFIFNQKNDSLLAHNYFNSSVATKHYYPKEDAVLLAYNRIDSSMIDLNVNSNSIIGRYTYPSKHKETNVQMYQPTSKDGVFIQGQLNLEKLLNLNKLNSNFTSSFLSDIIHKVDTTVSTSFVFQYIGMKKEIKQVVKTIVDEEFETKNIISNEVYFTPDVNLSIERNNMSLQFLKSLESKGIISKEKYRYLIIPGNYTIYLYDNLKNKLSIGEQISFTKDTLNKGLFYMSYIPNTFKHIRKEEKLYAKIKTIDSLFAKHIEQLEVKEKSLVNKNQIQIEIKTKHNEHSVVQISKVIKALFHFFNAHNQTNDSL